MFSGYVFKVTFVLFQVQFLSVRRLFMREVSSLAFDGLQSSLRELSLSFNLLEDVPTLSLSILTGLTHLDLSSNKLTLMATDSFVNMSSLQYLNLHGNLLHTIEDGAFNGASSTLKLLRLYKNPLLKELPSFKVFKQSMSIEAYGCSIENLTQAFTHDNQNVALLVLMLDQNDIRVINPITFRNLSISSLYLDNNYIEDICSGQFHDLDKIKRLGLGHNSLSIISRECFSNMSSLRQLTLESNYISEVHGFDGLGSLELLNLAHNQLTSINNFTFTGITKLKMLMLSYNQIRFISAFAFQRLPNLHFLNLRANMLTALATDMFPFGFIRAGQLNVAENPLQCDCSIAGFEKVAVHVTAESVCFSETSNKSYHLKTYTWQACLNDSMNLDTQTQRFNTSISEEPTLVPLPVDNQIQNVVIIFCSIVGTLFILLCISLLGFKLKGAPPHQ